MTCRIERLASSENTVVFRVSGRIEREHLITLKDEIARESGHVILDLTDVTLVEREAVAFLAGCERQGIELRNSPAFLREWLTREEERITGEGFNNTSRPTNDRDDVP